MHFAKLFGCAVVVSLVFAVPALADPGFTDDFDSYTPGALGSPWADWGSGTAPVGGATVVADGTAQSGANYVDFGAWTEPVRWFDNPLTSKDQIVDITFSVRLSDTDGGFDFFAGSMGTPGAAPTKQYGTNVGQLTISGDGASTGTGTVSYGGASMSIVADGSTWNTVTIRTIARSPNGLMGQGELIVNSTASGVVTTWALAPEGLNGLDFYPYSAGYDFDTFSVTQAGTAEALPWNGGTPESWYPGMKGARGGIESDGSRYIYALGGTGVGELYRYDTVDGTWTQLASRPTSPDYKEPHGLALTSNGKIVVAAGGGFPNDCIIYEYDIATDTWSSGIAPNNGVSFFDSVVQTTAVGDVVFGGIVPSQGGLLQYDASTQLYITGQGGPGSPTGWPWGSDLAYGGGQYLYQLSRDPNNGNATLVRWDVTAADPTANNWDELDTLSDLSVAFPTGESDQSALAYVGEGITSLYAIHQEWGVAGLYEIEVDADKLYAALAGSNDLYMYDVATDTWTTLTDALPFAFGSGDDLCAGVVPEPMTMSLLGLGGLALLRRRRR